MSSAPDTGSKTLKHK